MTLVVAAVMKNHTVMMSDGCLYNEGDGRRTRVKKVWKVPRGDVLVGFAGDWVDLHQVKEDWNRLLSDMPHDISEEDFNSNIIEACPDLFDSEYDYDLLIATTKAVYTVSSEGTVHKSLLGHGAIGSQNDYALGYLDAKSMLMGVAPFELEAVLTIASERSCFVSRPFDKLELKHVNV